MNNIKLSIRTHPKLHQGLKELAHIKRITLNQLCIELLEGGMATNGQDVLYESTTSVAKPDIEIMSEQNDDQYVDFIDQMLKSFGEEGLIAILKTEGYVADYVLIFREGVRIPASVDHDSIVQTMNRVTTAAPPNLMWIQIAHMAQILWVHSEEVRIQLHEQFKNWGA